MSRLACDRITLLSGAVLALGIAGPSSAAESALRVWPCDGAVHVAKEFEIPPGSRVSGVRFTSLVPGTVYPEIQLVPGRVRDGRRAAARMRNAAAEGSSNDVRVLWPEPIAATENVYHIVVRLPPENDSRRQALLSARSEGVFSGTAFIVTADGTLVGELEADLDMDLMIDLAAKSEARVLSLPVLAPREGVFAAVPRFDPPRPAAFPLTVVAEIDTVIDGDWTVFGDTDRDGMMEIISQDRRTDTDHYTLIIVERQPDNTYAIHYPMGLDYYLLTYATGDTDGDGKMEIIGQKGSQVIVLESPDPWSFPSRLAWVSPPISSVGGQTTVGDSDGDGRMEIIHSRNTFSGTSRLVIFENQGDDTYVEVYNEPLLPRNASTGEKVVLDLDQDGRREIAMCGSDGFVHIVESTGDDIWSLVFVDSTGLVNAYAAEGGSDSDGNGRPELFVRGNDFSVFPPATWPARVYEASGNDQFELVATIPVPGSGSGVTTDALGDLDGDGRAEYIATSHVVPWEPPGGLFVYKALAEGSWQQVTFVEDIGSLMGIAYACDLNQNGRDDIFWMGQLAWTSTPISRVFEYQPTSDVTTVAPLRAFRILPNPVPRDGVATLWSAATPIAPTLLVYDVRGRLVARHDLRGRALKWRPGDLAAGVYFVRLTDALGDLGATRALVLPAR